MAEKWHSFSMSVADQEKFVKALAERGKVRIGNIGTFEALWTKPRKSAGYRKDGSHGDITIPPYVKVSFKPSRKTKRELTNLLPKVIHS